MDHATITFLAQCSITRLFLFHSGQVFLDNFQAAKVKVVWSLWLAKDDNASQFDLPEKAKKVLIPEAINITRLKCFPAHLHRCYKNRTCIFFFFFFYPIWRTCKDITLTYFVLGHMTVSTI